VGCADDDDLTLSADAPAAPMFSFAVKGAQEMERAQMVQPVVPCWLSQAGEAFDPNGAVQEGTTMLNDRAITSNLLTSFSASLPRILLSREVSDRPDVKGGYRERNADEYPSPASHHLLPFLEFFSVGFRSVHRAGRSARSAVGPGALHAFVFESRSSFGYASSAL
jgi:hypothetical protein